MAAETETRAQTRAAQPAERRFGYRPELDGLRALAVLAVFVSHVGWGPLAGGWIGVGIFFVLSGYLITSILMSEWDRSEGIALRRFYLRRLLRLYPALLVMLAFCALFAPVFGDGGTAGGYVFSALATGLYFQDFVAGITGSAHGGFLHTWSLAVEEQFYLLWPPVLIFARRRRWSVLNVALAGVLISWALLIFTTEARPGTVPMSYAMPYSRAGELLLGCALAVALRSDPGFLKTLFARVALAPACLLGLGLLLLTGGYAGLSSWMPMQIIATALLAAGLITGLTADAGQLTGRLLRLSPLVGLGVVSYGFYLFHLPLLDLSVKYLPGPWAGQVLFALVMTMAAAVCSYRWLEKPLLRLKDRI
ncbi:acyltransferase family protein [Kineosporia babensis]|uniref:Acyltransferase n=1 Tax=Kineosporia babensis TaxID=499548 RepID=A0A9X1N763_9ACTN|nr:acyltransferase [Kineosporia babensis]MCD5309647.1 acyltransferase [Kineosporia babensis]